MARFCTKCGNEIEEWAVVCPTCGAKTAAPPQNITPPEDTTNGGLIALSVLIPMAGIILWAIMMKDTPKAAKTYGIASLIAGGVSILLYILIIFALALSY